jgi:predicted transcriptional regulator
VPLKYFSEKIDSMASKAKERWARIKNFASFDVITVQEESKVVDHVAGLQSWKIDFIVVKDKGKVVRGVIGRDQLNDIVNERVLDARAGKPGPDLRRLSFRDVIEDEDLREYYLVDQNNESSDPKLWMEGLPPREVVIVKDKTVKAVVGRRWFKRWLQLNRLTEYFGSTPAP